MIKVNGTKVRATIFPDKTSQMWKVPIDFGPYKTHFIEWDFESESEFMHIAQLKFLLGNCILQMSYLPYARQDKEVSNISTFALRPFAFMLNALNFKQVICLDPHSDQASKLISNFKAIYPLDVWSLVLDQYDAVCFLDKGAQAKYKDFNIWCRLQQVCMTKDRDPIDGCIKELRIESVSNTSFLSSNRSVVIVDDICDGGRTFIEASHLLLSSGFDEVGLCVSHGIFSRGLEPLREAGIKRIFTSKGEVK